MKNSLEISFLTSKAVQMYDQWKGLDQGQLLCHFH